MAIVLRTSQAHRDLVEASLRIAEANPLAADHWLDLIDEKCQMLARLPELGRQRPDFARNFGACLSATTLFSIARFPMASNSSAFCMARAIFLRSLIDAAVFDALKALRKLAQGCSHIVRATLGNRPLK